MNVRHHIHEQAFDRSVNDAAHLRLPARTERRFSGPLRHSLIVRFTHWTHAASFVGLVVSGIAILLAHPRFYWGEAGGPGSPSLFDLPLPFMMGGPSGWGRSLHFQCAWVSVLTGGLYVTSGLLTGHFRKNLLPGTDFSRSSLRRAMPARNRLEQPHNREANSYNLLQRISYLAVVFLVMPLMVWTGMAMSPAVVSVFPFLVTSLGGHQTARTLHLLAAILLVVFLFLHVGMVILAGFKERTRAMIFGRGR